MPGKTSSLWVTAIAAVVLASGTAGAANLVAVTACGQLVPDRTTGYLTADLDCIGFTGGPPGVLDEGAAVNLGRRSKLDLRGFTITGGLHGVLCGNVECGGDGRCLKARCEVFNGEISGDNGRGIGGQQPIVHDVAVHGFAVGMHGYDRLKVTASTVDGSSGDGVRAPRIKVYRSTISDNTESGIRAGDAGNAKATVVGSTVIDNATGGLCLVFPESCADITSWRRPHVRGSICGTSSDTQGGDWDVCAAD